eukprot:5438135-Prymnesium_polylepis.1
MVRARAPNPPLPARARPDALSPAASQAPSDCWISPLAPLMGSNRPSLPSHAPLIACPPLRLLFVLIG